MSLSISDALLNRIREHGRAAYPQECCGLLLGRANNDGKAVVDLKPMENTHENSRNNRYVIEPLHMLEAEKEARSRGVDIVGIYHSHPDHPARPSEFDREHAFPWYSYIVVSVEQGEPRLLTSWTLKEDRSGFDSEVLTSSGE